MELAREYSRAFRVPDGTKGKALFINGIPPKFYQQIRRKMTKENRSVRGLVLGLLELWLNGELNDGGRKVDEDAKPRRRRSVKREPADHRGSGGVSEGIAGHAEALGGDTADRAHQAGAIDAVQQDGSGAMGRGADGAVTGVGGER